MIYFLQIQGPPYLLERLIKLELGVEGSIFKIQSSKFQHQCNFLRYFGIEILRAVSLKLSLPHTIQVLLTVPKDMEDPVVLGYF